jgi:hypothetical protein
MSDDGAVRDGTDWRELVTVILLSITTVLTAWTGFQASKWGGAMSISFSQASTARLQASRFEADVNRQQSIQVALFTQWLQAHQADDVELRTFLEERFPEPLASALPAWVATQPLENPDAPATPFDMPEYVIPELALAEASDARADAKFTQALRNNQRGDNYTALTVGFAAVLFFTAMSGRMRGRRAQWTLLALGCVGFVALAWFLLTFPKLV